MSKLAVVILAAGQGTRMKSRLPKVLHRLADKPLLHWVLDTALSLNPSKLIVVAGHQQDVVMEASKNYSDVEWVTQVKLRGTGDALLSALPKIQDVDRVLVLSGDVPLVSKDLLKDLLKVSNDSLGLVGCRLIHPYGLGRVVRDANNNIVEIVEEKDANFEIKQIEEINAGIYSFPVSFLKQHLANIKSDNKQGEYYLPDLFALAVKYGVKVESVIAQNGYEIQGINDKLQLSNLERVVMLQRAENLARDGVLFADLNRVDIRSKDIEIAEDVKIDVNVILDGVKVGFGCSIGPNVCLKNVVIGKNVNILPNSVVEDAVIGDNCTIGPFARLRPGTVLSEQVKIGNFTEIKKANIGRGSKVNHLSYIGDAQLGSGINIGAGTITCNYDGVNKYKTVIEDGVFVGSGTQLVAPVILGKECTVGAGTTVMKDIPAKALGLNKKNLNLVANWVKPVKK